MKVQQIIIEKFKVLKDINQDMNGNHILIMGDNGQGKSSIIQFIEIALGSQKNVPPDAAGKGEIIFNKDGQPISFKVDFKDGKPVIKVRGKGISIDNKKSAIAELVGAVEFDVTEFVDLSKSKAGRKQQVEMFKSFLPKDVVADLAKFEADAQNKYNERAELGKEITKLKGSISLHELNNLPDFELEKIKPTDTAEVLAELKLTQDHNINVEKAIAGVESLIKSQDVRVLALTELQEKIEKLEKEMAETKDRIKDGKEYLKENILKPVEALEKKIEDADKDNLKYNKATLLLSDRAKLINYEEDYGEATALINSSKTAISDTIKQMDGPIDGLTYEDDELVYNGIPVNPDSLSSSEIIELGLRLKMAENKDLGILFIQRAESIGTERFKAIKDLADRENWQIIAEQVDRGKDLHFEILTDSLIS